MNKLIYCSFPAKVSEFILTAADDFIENAPDRARNMVYMISGADQGYFDPITGRYYTSNGMPYQEAYGQAALDSTVVLSTFNVPPHVILSKTSFPRRTNKARVGGSSNEGSTIEMHKNAHGFSLRDINPTGDNWNCLECAIATDHMLAGKPCVALPTRSSGIDHTIEGSLRTLMKTYGEQYVKVVSGGALDGYSPLIYKDLNNVIEIMNELGPGSRALIKIRLREPPPGVSGHWMNVANQKGTIRFLDGQIGTGRKDWNVLQLHDSDPKKGGIMTIITNPEIEWTINP